MKAIVVLGCHVNEDGSCSPRLAERVKEAVCHYNNIQINLNTIFILTGYRRSGLVSEARAAASLCFELGVKKEQLVLEEEASNTIENATKTFRIALELGVTEMLVVTSDFHVDRSKAIFDAVFYGQRIKLSYRGSRSNISPARAAALKREEEDKIKHLPDRLQVMMANAMY